VLPSGKEGKATEQRESTHETAKPKAVLLNFEDKDYQFEEGCGHAVVKVFRSGLTDHKCTVQFDTSDGDALSTTDYVSTAGTLTFEKGETAKEIQVEIIDDNEWAPDKTFYVRLYNAVIQQDDPTIPLPDIKIEKATTPVVILNDDEPGVILFANKTHAMKVPTTDEKIEIEIPLKRKDGADGLVLTFLKTVDGTAVAGEHYEPLVGKEGADEYEVAFENGVRDQTVPITVLGGADKDNKTFTVEITSVEPEGAKVGEVNVCTVVISDDENYKQLMEEVVAMMENEMDKYGVGTSSWGEQFSNAMNMGGDDGEEPEWGDYLMHFLSFYWKVLHAFIPPTDMGGGWYTFCISLVFIGGITALVGDAAKILGCCLGLPDAITAITFVALGTSLPDTFASVEATVSDDTADAAITNVTGSNSVNVFLGLGLPWTMATVYHAANGTTFVYPSGDLVFSVLVFFAFAFICIGLLIVRRFKFGGELGGNKMVAYVSSGGLALSWLLYVILSSMKTKGNI